MTYQEVMKDKPIDGFWHYFFLQPTYGYLIIFFLFAITIFLIWLCMKFPFHKNHQLNEGVFILSGLIALFFIASLAAFITFPSNVEGRTYTKWVDNEVKPYLHSLPIKQTTIVNKLNINSEDPEQNLVIFTINDKFVKVHHPIIKADLASGKKPVISFRINQHKFKYYDDNDFSKTINSGPYETTVHLPIDYKFK